MFVRLFDFSKSKNFLISFFLIISLINEFFAMLLILELSNSLSLGFKNNLRIGVTNQSPDFPIMTAGFFVSSNNIYFMLGPSGISYGSKFSF